MMKLLLIGAGAAAVVILISRLGQREPATLNVPSQPAKSTLPTDQQQALRLTGWRSPADYAAAQQACGEPPEVALPWVRQAWQDCMDQALGRG